MHDKGVARRVWVERSLLQFQDKKIDLVGRAAVCVPHFVAVPPLLQATDMLATLPRRIALWTVAHFPLVLLDLRYKPKTVEIEMVRDQSTDQDNGLEWLIDELVARCRVRFSDRRLRGPPKLLNNSQSGS
jgi:DNA-binding transcriptional LysR family regulator